MIPSEDFTDVTLANGILMNALTMTMRINGHGDHDQNDQ